jgi:flagellar M-ring protein FliF
MAATTASSAADVRARLRDGVGQFGPPQLAAIAILGVVAVIAGLWFLSWATSPTWSTIVAAKTPAETGEIVAALDSAGIPNRLTAGGTGVEVPAAEANRAQVVLGTEGLVNTTAEGWEILDRQGFTTSSFRQRIDLQRAMEGELARSIVELDGVESAEVNLAIPEERLFSEEQDLTTASVVVGGAIDEGIATSIANLVASSVPGLDTANVSVIDTEGRVLTGMGAGSGGQGQLKATQLMESQLEMDAQSMLAAAFGPGRAVVRVSADLNFDQSQVETTTYDSENQVALTEQTTQEGFSGGANGVPLGTLGTVDDVTDAGEIAGDGDGGSGYVKLESSSQFGVPTTITTTSQTPGQVERLTIAVLMDAALEPAPQAQEIQDLVAAAVGLDTERGDTIVVQSLEFDVAEDGEEGGVVTAAAAGGGMVGTVIGYATTGVAIVGMILVLLFLRKGLKNLGGARRDDVTDAARALGAGGAGEGGAAVDLPALERAQGDNTVNDLLRVIDNQNDEVADLLRGWLAESKA